MKKLQNLINHVAFVVDASSSMESISKDVVKIFDRQIEELKSSSKALNQETRVSVYTFADTVNCLVFDMDCLRMPSLAEFYKVYGWTALIDGAQQAILDLKKTPELYGDHSFLSIVLTDGEENRSRKYTAADLAQTIKTLPDNWTVAVFVPGQMEVAAAKRVGFPAQNIQVWDANSSKGVSEVGDTMRQGVTNYMQNRASGVRGTKSFFSFNTNVSLKDAKKKLQELNPNQYMLLPVHKKSVIKPFAESWTQKPYVQGSVYYLLTKKEKIQAYKQICIQEKVTGKVYSGTAARDMLGLPAYEVTVNPAEFKDMDIFVQSSSVNRNLMPGSKAIIMS
jgi:hypothetical protein